MIRGRTVLITGATGQLGGPVARALAEENDVWACARFSRAGSRAELESAGVHTAVLDLDAPDWSKAQLPSCVDIVLHFAAEIVGDDYDRSIRINAEGTGLLLHRFRNAAAALVVSTSAVYDLDDDPQHRFAEDDPLGDSKPLFGATYPVSKIAQEAVARSCSRMFDLPVTIARMNLSYGPNGGLPANQLDSIRQGLPVAVATTDTFHNPIHEDDVVGTVPGLVSAASVPATVVNWAGPETVLMRDYCTYLGELAGRDVVFDEIDSFVRSRAVDISRQVELVGMPRIGWREGMRQLVATRE